jgi:hypothetical protein
LTERPTADPGSFRDPDNRVFTADRQVFRVFNRRDAADIERLIRSEAFEDMVELGMVVSTEVLEPADIPGSITSLPDPALVVRHERIPFISYPYEWSFEMLKDAAALTLDLATRLLDHDYILKDATPYNVQFAGARPVFIDVGSFEPYEEGPPWDGYNQFCRLFLNPLLYERYVGQNFQHLLRSSLDGVDPGELRAMLPLRSKWTKTVFTNVVLQDSLSRRFEASAKASSEVSGHVIKRGAIRRMIRGLRSSAAKQRSQVRRSSWSDYESDNTYDQRSEDAKREFVESVLKRTQPGVVWDLGSNTGAYSLIAARHAGYVVAFDRDPQVVDAFYTRLRADPGGPTNVLPLVMDLVNPSPGQGWGHTERKSLADRGNADFFLALALMHHMVIAGEVPIDSILEWLASVAPEGVIEFVPREDPMARRLLLRRSRSHGEYSADGFAEALGRYFTVGDRAELPNGRILYSVVRKV